MINARVLFVFLMYAPMASKAIAAGVSNEISGEISRSGDTVHLEFKGRQNWNYDLRREGNKVILSVPAIDAGTISNLKAWTHPLVQRIEVEPGVNQGHELTFRLKGSDVESFDYLTDQPSRLVLDFYVKAPPKETKKETVAKVPAKQKLPTRLPPKKSGRQPASDRPIEASDGEKASGLKPEANGQESANFGVFDGGDPNYSRFEIKDHEIREEALIASRHNIYLTFPMLEPELTSLKELNESPPIYEINPEENDENKKARLLLTLFNKKRYAVFLKTLEFFEKEYPSSRYKEIVKYMEADVYYEMWKTDKSANDFSSALSRYHSLIEKFPKSPLAERTSLLIGFSYFERGDYLNALKIFQKFQMNFKDSKNYPIVTLAIGDSFRAIKNYDEALKTYEGLESDPSSGKYGIQASFKKGDVYFFKKDYRSALDEYRKSLKKHASHAGEFSNAFYNMAESLFWLRNYKESLTSYTDFLNRFPRSSHGGYAMTRIGELLEILGADQKKINGAYLESIFRYQGSVGAGVARVRLVSQRMPEMKEKEIETAVEELNNFAQTDALPKLRDFTTIMIADGYSKRKEFDKSLQMLISFYQNHPTTHLEVFKNRILHNISEQLKYQVERGKFLDALTTYGKYAPLWLKNADRIDIAYYLGRSYELAGVHAEASEQYRRALNKIYAIKGTAEEKERMVVEDITPPETLNLRLAAMSAAQKDYTKAASYLEEIKNINALTDSQNVERIEIAAEVALQKGQRDRAKKYLEDLVANWKGQPARVARPYLTLAELHQQNKDFEKAQVLLEKIVHFQTDSGQVPAEIYVKTLQMKGDLHLRSGQREDAKKVFSELLEKYEDSYPLDSIRYKLGMIHFEQGNPVDAEKAWASLKEGSVWARMAREQLEHSNWKNQYKKYINRIPAMSGMSESGKESKEK